MPSKTKILKRRRALKTAKQGKDRKKAMKKAGTYKLLPLTDEK